MSLVLALKLRDGTEVVSPVIRNYDGDEVKTERLINRTGASIVKTVDGIVGYTCRKVILNTYEGTNGNV